MLNENALQFDPAAGRDHVESYFIKLNEKTGERAVWLKATIFATAREPSRPVAEGWAIAFDRRRSEARHVAVKHTLPYQNASFSADKLAIEWTVPLGRETARAQALHVGDPPTLNSPQRVEGLLMKDGLSSGSISRCEHRIAWALRFSGDQPPISPLPFEVMYRPGVPTSKLVSPHPDVRFEGEVTVDGERWSVDGWRGMQGHNWGRRHADLYAWSHANVWEEDDEFVLEGLSASVCVGPFRTPLTTILCARHRGVRYDFNAPIDIVRARGEVTPRRWVFSASGKHGTIDGVIEAETKDMVGLYYANPHGPMTYCLNTKLARARIRFEARGRPPLLLTSRAAALEIGTRDEDHGVRMFV